MKLSAVCTAFLMLVLFQHTRAQNASVPVPFAKDIPGLEKEPRFSAEESAMMKHLARNIRYPAAARESGVSGTVVLSFIVGTDGSLSDFQVVKGVAGGCTEEALRVAKLMPKWEPAIANGVPVASRTTLPVSFRLQ